MAGRRLRVDALFDSHGRAAGPGSDGSATAPADDLRALDDAVVRQAIDWYVRLASGRQTAQDHAEFARWHDAQPDRACAWRRLQAMGDQVQGISGRVAPDVARATLAGAGGAPARRQALKALIWVGAGTTALYLVQDQVPWRRRLTSA